MSAPKAAGPYTPIVRAGPWLIVSGQVGMVDGQLVDGGVVAETEQALRNVAALLESEGATMADVVKTTVFLADIAEWPVMNEPYTAAFPEPRPARSAFGVAALPLGARVEIEAWAYVPGGEG